MKIKELPKDTNLQQTKVILPQDVYDRSSLPMYGVKNIPVYLQGWVMNDFFVKTNKKSTRIYPMFWDFMPGNIEEWEVVSDQQEK